MYIRTFPHLPEKYTTSMFRGVKSYEKIFADFTSNSVFSMIVSALGGVLALCISSLPSVGQNRLRHARRRTVLPTFI